MRKNASKKAPKDNVIEFPVQNPRMIGDVQCPEWRGDLNAFLTFGIVNPKLGWDDEGFAIVDQKQDGKIKVIWKIIRAEN